MCIFFISTLSSFPDRVQRLDTVVLLFSRGGWGGCRLAWANDATAPGASSHSPECRELEIEQLFVSSVRQQRCFTRVCEGFSVLAGTCCVLFMCCFDFFLFFFVCLYFGHSLLSFPVCVCAFVFLFLYSGIYCFPCISMCVCFR